MNYEKAVNIVRIIVMILILGLAVFVALSPNVVYAPVPRVILFLLVSLLPAILLGAEGAARVKIKLPILILTATGAAGFLFGLLFFLNYLAKPEEKIAVYQVVDEKGNPVTLDFDGAIDVSVSERGLSVTRFVEGNTVILIFPEQVGQAEIQVKKSPSDVIYTGQVNYAGTRTSKLKLGSDLKPVK
jgi:hypothetical protein